MLIESEDLRVKIQCAMHRSPSPGLNMEDATSHAVFGSPDAVPRPIENFAILVSSRRNIDIGIHPG